MADDPPKTSAAEGKAQGSEGSKASNPAPPNNGAAQQTSAATQQSFAGGVASNAAPATG